MSISNVEILEEGSARERFEYIHDTLRNRICLLDYLPNTRLGEDPLAKEFGISRTPLRRVLVRLESEGLLTSVHGVGTFVTDVDIDSLKQVYELRMELASLIGKLSPIAIENIDFDKFRELKIRAHKLLKNPSPREFAQLNMDIFNAISSLTKNTPLRETSERLYYQTARIWLKTIPDMDFLNEIKVLHSELDDIIQAITIGNLSVVGSLQSVHISMSFTRLWQSHHKDQVTENAI